MSEHQTDHRHETKGGCGCGGSMPAGVASVADPVCGMKVDPATSTYRHEHDGITDHFCCGGCRAKFVADPARYLSSSQALAASKIATDPVCGMKVDPATSKHRMDHDGTTYHFCSAGCRTKFSANPESDLKPQAAEPAKLGAIYTCPMHPQIRQVGRGAARSAAWLWSRWRSRRKRRRTTSWPTGPGGSGSAWC